MLTNQNFQKNINIKNFITTTNKINNNNSIFNLINTPNYLKVFSLNKLNSFRSHSTKPNAEVLRLIKKKKKSNKKYAELLQVTDSSTKQTKTMVQNLKANQLSDFISKTNSIEISKKSIKESNKNVNLDSLDSEELGDKFYDEPPVLFVGKNFKNIEIFNETEFLHEILESCHAFKENGINYKTSNISNGILQNYNPALAPGDTMEHIEEDETIHLNENESRNKKNKERSYKSKHHKTAEQELEAKQYNLNQLLNAYIETSVSNNMVTKAFAAIQFYRFKYKRNKVYKKICDINSFNMILHGFAEKGNIHKIKEILSLIDDDNLKRNIQTYAAIFECIGRLEFNDNNKELIQKYYEDLGKDGFTMNDVMDKSNFLYDQREIVLEVLRVIDPIFTPKYTEPILCYTNKLVNKLNENIGTKKSSDKENIIKQSYNNETLLKLSKEQLEHELNGYVKVKSIEKFPEENDTVIHYRKVLKDFDNMWRSQIHTAFLRDLNSLRHQTNTKHNKSINLYPYICSLGIENFTDIILQEIRSLAEGSETFSPTIGQMFKELGQKAQMRCQIELKKKNGILDKTSLIYKDYCKKLIDNDLNYNSRQIWQKLIYENCNGPSMTINEKSWPKSITVSIGRFIHNILMRDIKIDTNAIKLKNKQGPNLMPAFYSLYRNQGRVVKEEIKPHPILSRLFRGSQQQHLIFDTNLVPMVCPPQPWASPTHGGYLIMKSDFIRLPQQAVQQMNRINETPLSNLYPALDSLNQLASVPWEVNNDILDIIIEVFNNGGDLKLDVPQRPSLLDPVVIPKNYSELNKKEKFELFRQKLNHRRRQAEMYSLWCDALYRLSLANHFRDKVFWLPHNMDFRGRVYPIPPHLNHLGSDLARSLLIFHEKRPLGPNGFDWLKLHCINLTGLKKHSSIDERLEYVEEIMDDILDSARNPLNGRMWWTKSDEPWQTLSCCLEIAKVLKCENPEEYMSSFPIHQDGSCNGLQHYAALGRDSAGAKSVNLCPSKNPQDVYSAVARLVEEFRKRDANNGVQVAQILDGFVKRKVIKQTVMTTVYGVTRYGARLQIARQLKDIDEFPKDWVWPASSYLTLKTFESLREMFTSTKQIQDWFTECAKQISSVCVENVEWITPLGLPIVQPYNKYDKKYIGKSNNKVVENLSLDQYEKPNVMKQKNAFPPNFIHSLDSSHMMLTSLHCENAGLTFISVHDCFWTHACTVPIMNKICREQFVALHSEHILEDLSLFLENKYSYSNQQFQNNGSVKELAKKKLNRVLMQVPKTGDFNLNNVLKSVYFFS